MREVFVGIVLVIGMAAGPAPAQKSGQAGVDVVAPETTDTPPPVPAEPTAPDGDASLTAALETLGATFPEGEVAAFRTYLDGLPPGVTAATIGHLMYMRRHWDKAAWFFGTDAVADPTDVASLNNVAAMLAEVHADADGALPDSLLLAAHDAARAATALDPQGAAGWNNLGRIALVLGRAAEAAEAARRATELAPDEPLYWSNLARALEAAGDSAGAAEALARARALEPNGIPYLSARAALPSGGAYSDALARVCNVNFRCQEICPKSIIGGIQSVTCEIENTNAQAACLEGKPYPTAYDCSEDLPDYGILIPGLNSGFSACVPGFCVHVLVDGEGNVDARVEAGASVGPVTGYVTADGHYSPENGFSYDNVGGGVRWSLVNGSTAGNVASGLGHPPVHVEAESTGGGPVSVDIETYNMGVISI
ncbi:tetratricopeptide repeat protein [Psychromarinibacter sp. C21-152]|uniref:Tetratricopeptide repeat protein n=1 Tax=Psychromarinibacter sediminicola TaxID=3033385 RepID=A0AAE3T9P7_9RHOB|nr:tetratricopeptide repeat protein [Psychromarinibacter sediminicola]MDF0600760.1 tetratricopeptide repeat protein [Psychromarinibacter sediminicola]